VQRILVIENGREEDQKLLEGYFEAPRIPVVGETIQFDFDDRSIRGEVTNVVLKVSPDTREGDVAEVHVRRERFDSAAG
jgi:hypothetical protein